MCFEKSKGISSSPFNKIIHTNLYDRFLFYLILSVFFLVTCIMSIKMNIWLDESYTMHTTGSNLFHAAKQAVLFEEQPPFYFVALSLWRHLNGSIVFARLFSILCILVSSLIVGRLAKDISPKGNAFLLCLILSNPLALWASTEIRIYALAIFLSSILFWNFYSIFIKKSQSSLHHICFIAVSILSLYTQYFLGTILIVNFIYLVLMRDWRAIRRYSVYMIIVGICFTPFFFTSTIQQFHSATSNVAQRISLFGSCVEITQLFLNIVLPGSESCHLLFKWWKIVIIICIILAVVIKLRRINLEKSYVRLALLCFLSIAVGIPIFSMLLYVLGDKDLLPQRYVLFFLPEILFLVFLIVIKIRHTTARTFLAVIMIAYNVANSAITYYPMKKHGDWKQVARYVEQNVHSDEPIFIYFPANILPFSYYYHMPNRVIPIPHPPELAVYDPGDFVLNNAFEIDTIVCNNLKNGYCCWFVINSIEKYRNLSYNAHLLPEYIQQHFEIKAHQYFLTSEVYHVVRR